MKPTSNQTGHTSKYRVRWGTYTFVWITGMMMGGDMTPVMASDVVGEANRRLQAGGAAHAIAYLENSKSSASAADLTKIDRMLQQLNSYRATTPAGGGATRSVNTGSGPAPAGGGVYTPWLFPDSSRRALTEAEVARLDASELWRARNEIFARHGLIFRSQRGQDFVRSLGQHYRAREADSEKIYNALNAVEKQNVNLIKSYESR